jgi:hypothetical protein
VRLPESVAQKTLQWNPLAGSLPLTTRFSHSIALSAMLGSTELRLSDSALFNFDLAQHRHRYCTAPDYCPHLSNALF